MHIKHAATLLALIAASTAHAQSTKPGLWEMTNKMGGNAQMDSAMAEAQKQMAAMPPDQRKMMEEMMAKQGINMPTAKSGGAMGIKICITPEMAARNEMPNQQDGDCTTTITSRSGSTMKAKFVCTEPPMTGEGTYTFSGDTAYTADIKMRTTQNGKPENMTIQASGKWLSSSCGAIKPLVAPTMPPTTKGK